MTAAESGTYTDFANINLGGLLARRLATARTSVSHLLLEVIDEMHLLQPSLEHPAVAQDPGRAS